MIGGIVGLVTTILLIFIVLPQVLNQKTIMFNKIFIIIITLYAIFGYSLSFFSGLFLWKKQKKGIILSIITQIIQIPKLTIAGFSYSFISGLEFTFMISNSFLRFTTYIGSHWNIAYYPENKTFLIGINFIAIILLIYLIKEYKKK